MLNSSNLLMCGVIPALALSGIGYCRTLTGSVPDFSSINISSLCRANPTLPVSAQAWGNVCNQYCKSYIGDKGVWCRRYSSLRLIVSTCIGCPSLFRIFVPSGWKLICAPTLVSKSRPNKGQGHSGMTMNEWDTWPTPRSTVLQVVHEYCFIPVAPCTHEVLSANFPWGYNRTEC